MPGKVKVRILAGRNLPVMDKSSDTSDAFVEVKLGSTTYKTEVYRRSLNPYWNSEWFRFEIDDEELQDEPLQIRIMDYDTYSANDAIGKVYIDLNPLLQKDSKHVLSGWFPIYDTMHGIRGEINCIVKVALISDANRYRQSSCGFKFFYSPKIPEGYVCEAILGFVEELVVNHDPEYQWIDKIRTPRASNEARQTLFSKISGEVQRKIGIKALDLGGNAVVGYQQHFDLEGESGIVVRGIGTAVLISKLVSIGSNNQTLATNEAIINEELTCKSASPTVQLYNGSNNVFTADTNAQTQVQSSSLLQNSSRRLSDSDLNHQFINNHTKDDKKTSNEVTTGVINVSNGGNNNSSTSSFNAPLINGANNTNNKSSTIVNKMKLSPEKLQLLEYPFLTLKTFPSGLIANIGGIISARSVKLLDQINNPDDPETRDAWWTELRKEVRSHKKTLNCNAVLGYTETAYINDEICILSACGTAALLKASETDLEQLYKCYNNSNTTTATSAPYSTNTMTNESSTTTTTTIPSSSSTTTNAASCHICHVPYQDCQVPFPTNLMMCSICQKYKVPDFLFMTIEPYDCVQTIGYGTLIQARVCRPKRECKGEQCAKEISDGLPFLEYELYRQLLTKLKIKGMNCLFNISIQISFGENMLVAVATGTGTYLTPLHPPSPPKISSGKGIRCSKLNEIQALISDSISRNRKLYNLYNINYSNHYSKTNDSKRTVVQSHSTTAAVHNDNVSSLNDDLNSISITNDMNEQTTDNNHTGDNPLNDGKDTCVLLEVDDTEDAEIISLMIDSDIPKGFDICNSEYLPGKESQFVCNLQMFAQVFRTKLQSIKQFGHQFDWIIQTLFIKFRSLIPCCLTDLKFRIDIPEADIIQITVTGASIGMGPPPPIKVIQRQRSTTVHSEHVDNDLIFMMDNIEHFNNYHNDNINNNTSYNHFSHFNNNQNYCEQKNIHYHSNPKEHFGIELTPLSYIPKAQISNYLGNLDFFFIRESSSIRDYGGLSGFVHNFMTEVFAIVRSHVSSLSGNAMTSFHVTQLLLLFNPHKNQAQCLINVAGDVVQANYHCEK